MRRAGRSLESADTALDPKALRGCCQARRLGRSIRKYLRRNLPSRERSGPPQQMHATSPSAVGPGVASKPTTSYFAEANGAMEQSCESFRHAQSSLRSGEYSLRKRSKFLAVPLDGTLRHDPEPTSDRPAIGGKSKGRHKSRDRRIQALVTTD